MFNIFEDKKFPNYPIGIALILFVIVVVNNVFFGLIASLISFYCAWECYKEAKINKGNIVLAFFIGLIFSFIGLLIYSLYWSFKRK